MDSMMHIGSEIKSDDLELLANSIVKVATASPFKSVNVAALDAFSTIARVGPVNVTGCSFTANPDVEEACDEGVKDNPSDNVRLVDTSNRPGHNPFAYSDDED